LICGWSESLKSFLRAWAVPTLSWKDYNACMRILHVTNRGEANSMKERNFCLSEKMIEEDPCCKNRLGLFNHSMLNHLSS
jgi:hypothetical protein